MLRCADNLVKRQNVDDLSSLFCAESETCDHLFFDCVVASTIWAEVRQIMNLPDAHVTFSSIAELWKNSKKKYSCKRCIYCCPLDNLAYKE
jgi:hypothetical protein